MTDVSFCEDGVGLFYFFRWLGDSPAPHPVAQYAPPVGGAAPAHPEAQATTRPDAGHAAPGRSGR